MASEERVFEEDYIVFWGKNSCFHLPTYMKNEQWWIDFYERILNWIDEREDEKNGMAQKISIKSFYCPTIEICQKDNVKVNFDNMSKRFSMLFFAFLFLRQSFQNN